jgi:hypothetical protein
MNRLFSDGIAVVLGVLAVSGLAIAGETVVETHTYEAPPSTTTVEVVPAPPVQQRVIEQRTVTEERPQRVIEERTVTQERPVIQKRTDTVTTTTHTEDED